MITLKTLIFTLVMPGTVAGVLPWRLLQMSGATWPLFPSFWWLGFLPLLLGIGLYFWCAGAFTFLGKGTPAPIDAPKFLVKAGPYSRVRNPMYIAVLSVLTGETMLFRSFALVGYALVVAILVHTFVVFVEEPMLHKQFGESYESYLHTVSRWFPRIPNRRR